MEAAAARTDSFTFETSVGVATRRACPVRPSQNVPCCPERNIRRHSTTAVSDIQPFSNEFLGLTTLCTKKWMKLAGHVRLDSAPGTPAFNGVTLSPFALMSPFYCTAHSRLLVSHAHSYMITYERPYSLTAHRTAFT
jgi:hypothetical protein